uniref:Uncharacterized protein n=1 Tax=viral metagenome TaxID=1070528 RepID=A0A6M3IS68_9ZZZZ
MKPIKNSQMVDFDVGDFIVARWAAGSQRCALDNRYIIEGTDWCVTHWGGTNQPSMENMCKTCLSGNLAYVARKFRSRRGSKVRKLCAGRSSVRNDWIKVRDPRLGDINETNTQQ